jgi:hypothetical protein
VVPADLDPATSTYTKRVSDVTIIGFRILGFDGNGVYGFGTKNLRVSKVRAAHNDEYGMASYDGVGTTFTRNTASGSGDAGIYIGDSLHAHAVVLHNRSWNNATNILVRHARQVLVADNTASRGCFGVLLLNDGQPGGSGDTAVLDNRVRANNRTDCPGWAEYLRTPVGGGGIVVAGSQHNLIAHNRVLRNRGTSYYAGGIVLVATTLPRANGSYAPSINNVIVHNRLSRNKPADIVQDKASSPNLIANNRCRTSVPKGLCGVGSHRW